MMMKYKLFLLFVVFGCSQINSQTILSEGFEGPLTGWFNSGNISGGENSILPNNGSGMASLGSGKYLESSYFNLPAGNKNVSFFINSYIASFFSYTITLSLYQNSSPIMSLGSWYSASGWSQKGVNIPAGYSGNDFSIRYTVASNGGSTLRFYIDDILVEPGFTTVSLNEQHSDLNFIDVRKNHSVNNELLVTSSKELSKVKIQLVSIDGKMIYEKGNTDLSQEPIILPLNEINAGLYFIKFISNNQTIIRKLVL